MTKHILAVLDASTAGLYTYDIELAPEEDVDEAIDTFLDEKNHSIPDCNWQLILPNNINITHTLT